MTTKQLLIFGAGTLMSLAASAQTIPVMNPAKSAASGHSSSGRRLASVNPPLAVEENAFPDNLAGYVPNVEIAGIYSIPMTYEEEFELLCSGPECISSYSSVEVNGVYYTVQYYYDEAHGRTVTIHGLDSRTWEPLSTLEGTPGCCGIDTAYDPVTGRVYGCFMNDDMTGVVFGYIDFSEEGRAGGKVTRVKISDLDKTLYGVAIDGGGQVYGITNNGDLYNVDKETGALTLIGATGLADKYMTSATIDLNTGRMYYAVSNDGYGAIYEINPATAESSYITQFYGNEEIIGMFASRPPVEPEAPAAVTGLSMAFDLDSKKGSCSFTAPTRLYNGSSGSGPLTYTVRGKLGEDVSKVLASGATSFGQTETFEVEVAEDGLYEFWVYVSNSVGDGAVTKHTMFVGHDTPKAPALTSSVYSNGRTALSWAPVTESESDGYILKTDMKYDVVRTNDGKIVATGLTDTSVVDEVGDLSDLTVLYYEVTASDGVKTSAPAVCPKLVAGVAALPYVQSFENEDSFRFLTSFDSNGDEKTWAWSDMYEGTAKLAYTARWASDDWLMLPGMKLEKGKSYVLAFRPFGGDSYKPEKYEVRYGSAAVPEAMTEELLAVNEINNNNAKSEMVECILNPAETGVYYIGFHGVSEKLSFNLYIDDIAVSEGVTADSPRSVSGLKVATASDGKRSATITFKAPAEKMNGEPLSTVSKISVLRDGTLIKSLEDVEPGSEQMVTDDNDLAIGQHEWTVFCFNGEAVSRPASVSAHVGFDLAVPVTDIVAVEGPEDGVVTLTWNPSTEDVRGNKLPEGAVSYTVYERHDFDNPLAVGVTDTRLTCRVVLPEGVQQAFRQFMVVPVTEAGENYDGDMSLAIPVGTPFECPYVESFPDQDASYPLGLMTSDSETMRWGVYDSGMFLDSTGATIDVYDDDHGMAVFFGLDPGCTADMISPKLRLPVENPQLSFYLYPMSATDANEIHVFVKCDGVEEELGMVVMHNTGPALQWNRAAMQLSEYAGKVVSLRFNGVVRTHSRTFMDRVQVARGADRDLAVKSIGAPSAVRPGVGFDVAVEVANYGALEADGYTVDLICNGENAVSYAGPSILPGEVVTVKVPAILSALGEEENYYTARVNLPGDEDEGNDLSGEALVKLRRNPYPPVADLEAVREDDGVRLSWSEPDINDMVYEEYEETFETGEDWQFAFEDWTFIDLDGGTMGAFDNVQIPDMTPADTPTNFFVFNSSNPNFSETYDAHSGTKYLAVVYNYNEVQNNDWAISPLLCGAAQEISFYAKSYHPQYHEDIEVLYTDEDFDPENFDPGKFVSVGVRTQIEATWKPYSFQLPEGAKHFAIRCISNDAMMLMVDDVTYIPAAGAEGIAHMGYNVYRDGLLLNDSYVEEPEYIDAACGQDPHVYQVTAVYDLGESVPSDISVDGASVERLEAEGISVAVTDGAIVVKGAGGRRITVSDIGGRIVYSSVATSHTVIPLSGGLYVVTAGPVSRKLSIR